MFKTKLFTVLSFLTTLSCILAVGCTATTTTTTSTVTTGTSTTSIITTTVTPFNLTVTELKYLLLDAYPDYFWCDSDFYPVARAGQEQQNAIDQFSAIQSNTEEFSQILKHLNLHDQTTLTNEQELLIYREYKKLNDIITIIPSGSVYTFSLRTGQGQGFLITGTISLTGKISEGGRTVSFNTCPVCLPTGTLIDTPQGQIAVEKLLPGMMVWTANEAGRKILSVILKTSSIPIPADWMLVKLTLSDGRSVTASLGHPSADMRALGDHQVGDTLDGSIIVLIEQIVYSGTATYDILPAGATGFYWADGVLLGSTLK